MAVEESQQRNPPIVSFSPTCTIYYGYPHLGDPGTLNTHGLKVNRSLAVILVCMMIYARPDYNVL